MASENVDDDEAAAATAAHGAEEAIKSSGIERTRADSVGRGRADSTSRLRHAASADRDASQEDVVVLNSGTVPTSALVDLINADVHLALEATADAGTASQPQRWRKR